jgi:N6-adenosine-specific RNA methylase IME4
MTDYKFHQAAEVFPLLAGAEFKELVDSMQEHGFDPRHPIVVYEDAILDGRNRYLAARAAGVEAVYSTWEPAGLNAFEFAWQENATRRHLEQGTKACCFVKRLAGEAEWLAAREAAKTAANERRSEAAKEQHEVSNPRIGESSGRLSCDKSPEIHRHVEAAKTAGVGAATMAKAFALHTSRPDLFEEVCKSEITLTEGERLKRKAEVRAKLADLPKDKFRVLYADPPWNYNDDNPGTPARVAADHYPCMPLSEICAMDIASIVHDDAVLFLWATSPLLPEGLEIMKAWGFKYKAGFVWDKIAHMFGNYNSVRHEHLLLGTRGSCLPESDKLIGSVQSIKKSGGHSSKPKQFREIIDTLYPQGERLELFARGDVPAPWRTWGAEVETIASE